MTAKPECVSDMLHDLQHDLAAVLSERGEIHLDASHSAKLVKRVKEMSVSARNLENAWSQAEWNRRALEDGLKLLSSLHVQHIETHKSALQVLHLMRKDDAKPGCVILPFPQKPKPPSGPSFPPGGHAA
ncbi:MAG: hypothetical protein PGN20_15195 [Agrobacterium cavarae]